MGSNERAHSIRILLVEDNPGDVRLIEEAFNTIRVPVDFDAATTAEQALRYLNTPQADRPDLILLDLNLPGLSGFDFLDRIKDDGSLKALPVIVLTSSDADDDVKRSYEAQANAYLTKPVAIDDYVELARSISEFWIQRVELPPSTPEPT